jgi:glutamine amidotransferase
VSALVVIDSGGANLASLEHCLARLGVETQISRDPAVIRAATRVILPGVGAAAAAMQRLAQYKLIDTLRALQQPVLGICLGMQLLFERSAEGQTPCLGIIAGGIEALHPAPGLTVPHMGWNTLQLSDAAAADPLLAGLGAQPWFYFVHGYYLPATHPAVLAHCEHGVAIGAVVRQRNFWGVQFHPERSARAGAQLIDNFLRTTS